MDVSDHDALRRLLDSPHQSEEERAYAQYHAPRFAFVLSMVDRYLDRLGASPETPARYLDIGPHILTRLVAEEQGQRVHVSTLGWENRRLYPSVQIDQHFPFDLNDAWERDRWPRLMQYDLVVAAEVIEHPHTAPEYVLDFLRELVRPGGYLVLQTPNAAAARNRLLMLAGRNPFERIRTDLSNPGHFREYTRSELVELAGRAGFTVEEAILADYFRSNPLLRLAGLVAPGLRRGLTLVLRRPD